MPDIPTEPTITTSDGRIDVYNIFSEVLGIPRDRAKKLVLWGCYSGGLTTQERREHALVELLFQDDGEDSLLRLSRFSFVMSLLKLVELGRPKTLPLREPDAADEERAVAQQDAQRKPIDGLREVADWLDRPRAPLRSVTDDELKLSIIAILESHPELRAGFAFSRLVDLLHECQALGETDDSVRGACLYPTHPVRKRVVGLFVQLREEGRLVDLGFTPLIRKDDLSSRGELQ